MQQVNNSLPPPNSDESLLQFSSGEQQRINALPIGDPERVAAIESGQFIPTDGDLEWMSNVGELMKLYNELNYSQLSQLQMRQVQSLICKSINS